MTTTPATHHRQDPYLEKRLIVGTLALDSSSNLAEVARTLLEVPEPSIDCARLTADFRRLLIGHAEDPASPGQP